MALAYALLTALAEKSCSGSELAARFDRSLGYFWPATHQQIYRELARLEEAGWAVSEVLDSAPGRKRVYRLLPEGRDELERWIAAPRAPKPIRDDLLVKIRAEAVLGGGALGAALPARLDRHRARLMAYSELDRRYFGQAELTREQRLQRLILKSGIELERLWVEVCEEAARILAEED